MSPPFVLLGVVSGFLVGLTGVGGGSLVTPSLSLLFGVAPATAIGTDIFFGAMTKVSVVGSICDCEPSTCASLRGWPQEACPVQSWACG